MLAVEVKGLDKVQAALSRASTGIEPAMKDAAKAAVSRLWVPTLSAKATTRQQSKLLIGASSDVYDGGFDLIAGAGPALSGGLDQSHWYAVDYGMKPKRKLATNRRVSSVSARTGRKSRRRARVWVGKNLPPRKKGGRVIEPTLTTRSQDFVDAYIDGILEVFPRDLFDVKRRSVKAGGAWR